MIKKITTFAKNRKKTTATAGVASLALAAVMINSLTGAAPETKYVVQTVARETVSTTISGTGQIWGETQIDVKPEASTKITSVKVKNGSFVKAGTILATLDAGDAQKTVRDASLSLRSAELAYAKLVKAPSTLTQLQTEHALEDAKSTLSNLESPSTVDVADAQVAVDTAERSLNKAERNLESVQSTNATDSVSPYTDAYGSVSSAFVNLPDVMQDLKNVLGSETHGNENIAYYKLLIDPIFTDRVEVSVTRANTSYAKAFSDYSTTSRTSDPETITALVSETLDAATNIADALDNAATMFDEMSRANYGNLAIADTIDELIPAIESDINTVKSDVSSLNNASDAITKSAVDVPNNLADAQDAVSTAQVNLAKTQQALEDLIHPSAETLRKAQAAVLEKTASLEALNSGTDPLDLESQKLSLEGKRNALADALETYSKYTVKAPMDGTVAGLTVKTGQTLGTGALLTMISNQQSAKIDVNEIDAAKISVGQKATLTFDAVDGLEVSGHVADVDIMGTVAQGVVSYGVVVILDTEDARIKPGMSSSVTIITAVSQNALTVPTSAVKTSGGSSYVEVFDPALTDTGSTSGTASKTPPIKKPVTTGLVGDTSTEILSGLNEGDQIVVRTITATTTTKTTSAAPSILGGSTGGSRGGGMPSGGPSFIGQ